jgi:hypothetical protein
VIGMCEALSELVIKAQRNDEGSMIELIKKFNPIVKKYSKLLNYDGSETDLIITFIKAVKTIQI